MIHHTSVSAVSVLFSIKKHVLHLLLFNSFSPLHFFHIFIADSPPVIRSFSPRVAEEGDRVTLKCKPSMIWPPEEITYYVNGRPITDPRFNSRYKANCQKLRIDKVKYPDDNAVFTCKVHNKYGVDVKNATLRVLGKSIMVFTVPLLAFGAN